MRNTILAVVILVIFFPVAMTGCSDVGAELNKRFVEDMDTVADRAIPTLTQLVELNWDLDGDGKPDLDEYDQAAWRRWLLKWRELVNAAMEAIR